MEEVKEDALGEGVVLSTQAFKGSSTPTTKSGSDLGN
jgi:hypothetical protein